MSYFEAIMHQIHIVTMRASWYSRCNVQAENSAH